MLPQLLICGVNINEFWDLSLAEMNLILEAYVKSMENKSRERYELAKLIAIFVNCGLGGTPIPEYEDVYMTEEIREEEDRSMQLYKEQFIDYANKHNAKRKGDLHVN